MKLSEIAARLQCELEGDPDVEVTAIATLETALAGELSFLANPKYRFEVDTTRASALIVGRQEVVTRPISLLRHSNPYMAFAKAVEIFSPSPERPPAIHPTASIAPTAKIGDAVNIGAYAVIEKNAVVGSRVTIGSHSVVGDAAVIGDDCIIHSGCVIRERVRIGSRCILQDRVVLGSDGFGYAKQENGSWYKIKQAGTVVLEDDVEVGAGTTIDRPALGSTLIGQGAKIDNLVQIGHGCRVGRNSMICAQAGLAGSTRLGDNVILAGQVGVAGHLTIGDGVVATAQTGIPSSVESGQIISGYPAIDNKQWLRSSAVFNKLPEIYKAIRRLTDRMGALEKAVNKDHKG
jgi:UDP-3-O-[3-hydroxymyristoyl] glucosamine N-acyltransferase